MSIVSMNFAEMNPKKAEDVIYDNTTSGLEADNVQDAIDEVMGAVNSNTEIIDLTGSVTFANTLVTNMLKVFRVGKVCFITGYFKDSRNLHHSQQNNTIIENLPKAKNALNEAINVNFETYYGSWAYSDGTRTALRIGTYYNNVNFEARVSIFYQIED